MGGNSITEFLRVEFVFQVNYMYLSKIISHKYDLTLKTSRVEVIVLTVAERPTLYT